MAKRPLIPLSQAQPPYFVGVDLGGTNIKTGLVDDRGQTLARTSVATEFLEGPEAGTQRMAATVATVMEEAGLKREEIAGVGLGSPGTMDIPAGKILIPVNLKGWDDFPVRDRLAELCGFHVTFANDANAAAYGEFWVGSGSEFPSMVLITLGTGIGGGIIIGDLSVDGEHSHGSECGHIIIDYHEDARLCSCGKTGHLEAYASAISVVKRAEEALASGRWESSVSPRIAAGEELTPLMLAEEAGQGDEFSRQIVMDTARYLGIGLVTLMHTIDPAAIVLGGAMTFGRDETELGRRFMARINEEIQHRAFPVPAGRVQIRYASLGSEAGYIGAAGRARLAWHQQNKVAS